MNETDCRALVTWYGHACDDYGPWERELQRVVRAMLDHAVMTDDKANRWLGYVQGWLSAHRVFTVDDLRTHIRNRVWENS